jgi:hypothetical protein
MEVSVSKIDAATDQMDWAIRLFLDHKAYLPAITLAGAAEEILGEMLGDKSAFSQMKTAFVTLLGMNEKVVSQDHLNRARNWLKHWKGLKDAQTISIDLESEAIQYIVRALTNLARHDGSQPSEGPRFSSWMDANRPELAEDEPT